MKHQIGLKTCIGIVVAAVVIVAGLGFWYAGSPAEERARKLDEQRINNLIEIMNSIDFFYNAPLEHRELPSSLVELIDGPYERSESILDPLTRQPYEYRVMSPMTYELCVTFQTQQQTQEPSMPRPIYDKGYSLTWRHPIGRTCFTRSVNVRPVPVK